MTNEPLRLALSYVEAAAALSISKSKLEKLVRDGQVCSVKIGERRVFPLDELRDYMDR